MTSDFYPSGTFDDIYSEWISCPVLLGIIQSFGQVLHTGYTVASINNKTLLFSFLQHISYTFIVKGTNIFQTHTTSLDEEVVKEIIP